MNGCCNSGNLNIFINEAGCLNIKNFTILNGIWYTLNNQNIVLTLFCVYFSNTLWVFIFSLILVFCVDFKMGEKFTYMLINLNTVSDVVHELILLRSYHF